MTKWCLIFYYHRNIGIQFWCHMKGNKFSMKFPWTFLNQVLSVWIAKSRFSEESSFLIRVILQQEILQNVSSWVELQFNNEMNEYSLRRAFLPFSKYFVANWIRRKVLETPWKNPQRPWIIKFSLLHFNFHLHSS